MLISKRVGWSDVSVLHIWKQMGEEVKTNKNKTNHDYENEIKLISLCTSAHAGI